MHATVIFQDDTSATSLAAPRPSITRSLILAYAASLIVAVLIAAASAVGLAYGSPGLYGSDPAAALGITPSVAGVLVPGFLAHDMFNLLAALPVLLVVVWLARRGSLLALLLWPGALFYVLYTYAIYLVGAPFGPLFLAYVALVALSACTILGLLASIDADAVGRRLSGVVPARTVAGLLVGFAALTLAQDASGAIATALAGGVQVEPLARRVWTGDLALEVPALLAGGVLLWRRVSVGYAAAPALLFQFGLTPIALAAILTIQPLVSGAPFDVGAIVGILVFAVVPFAPLALFARGLSGGLRQQVAADSFLKEGSTP